MPIMSLGSVSRLARLRTLLTMFISPKGACFRCWVSQIVAIQYLQCHGTTAYPKIPCVFHSVIHFFFFLAQMVTIATVYRNKCIIIFFFLLSGGHQKNHTTVSNVFVFVFLICRKTYIQPSSTDSLIFGGIPFYELPVIHIKATYNNTHINVTDHTGREFRKYSPVCLFKAIIQ